MKTFQFKEINYHPLTLSVIDQMDYKFRMKTSGQLFEYLYSVIVNYSYYIRDEFKCYRRD